MGVRWAGCWLMLSCLGWSVRSEVADDLVVQLPGWGSALPSKHYSGYLDIPGGKHLHYYLVLKHGSENGVGEPTILWTNGGPGCSSLDGLYYEHGPFRINETDNSQLVEFPFAWSKLANMLYLEAPAGVGFSYADDKSAYNTNDDQTAQDNLAAMQKFFQLFPELKAGDFFLTGESYSGIYTPTLAEAIMRADKKGEWDGPKLRGIAVGNGCTGTELGACSNEGNKEKYLTQYLAQTFLVSPESKDAVDKACGDFSGQIPAPQGECKDAIAFMHSTVGNVNLYNVYGECHNHSSRALKAPIAPRSFQVESLMVGDSLEANSGDVGPVACIDSRFASAYLSRPEVVKALHVKQPPYVWGVCVNQINYTSTRKNLPRDTYPELVEYLDRTIIYNGDFDACVPITDNMDWTKNMAFPVEKPWHPWTYVASDGLGKQVAGYAVRYSTPEKGNEFSFVSVRGGRHEVPETAPEQAYELVRRLINGESF